MEMCENCPKLTKFDFVNERMKNYRKRRLSGVSIFIKKSQIEKHSNYTVVIG